MERVFEDKYKLVDEDVVGDLLNFEIGKEEK